jgi:subtilisin family serine protease
MEQKEHEMFSILSTKVAATAAAFIAVAAVHVLGSPRQADASDLTGLAVPGEIIVRYDASASPSVRRQLAAGVEARGVRKLRLPRTELVKLPAGANVEQTIAELEQQPGVLSAEPNLRVRALTTPDDSYFGSLWGLNNTGQRLKKDAKMKADADIDAPEAWDTFSGNGTVTVAVIDTGVDYTHPDLIGSVNGGYDFADNDPDPMDEHYHGTHVAGTIGAHGNNGVGVTGVNWNVNILPIRVLDSDGGGTLESVVNGIAYAGQQGADVANMSIGYYGHSPVVEDAINAAGSTLFVAAAGNDTNNDDGEGMEPCTVNAPNMLCVAATNPSDKLAWFSNYGRRTVDVAAPGVDVLSTVPGAEYALLSGTSMATPHVAGIAALALGLNPSLTTEQLKQVVMKGVDKRPSLKKKCVTGGRANAAKTLRQALALKRLP